MGDLTSTLTVRLIDAVSGPARAAAAALKALDATARGVKGGNAPRLDRTARALAGVDRSAAALARTGKSMPALTVGDPAALQRAAKGVARVTRETSALGQASRAVSGVGGKGSPLADLSADLKQHLVGLRLTRGEYRALGRDFVRMRADHGKALDAIGNPKIREQVRAQDGARIEGQIRARAARVATSRQIGDGLSGSSVEDARGRVLAERQTRRDERAKRREQHRYKHGRDHLGRHVATAVGLDLGVRGVERGAHYVAEQGAAAASEDLREKLQGFTPEQIAETNKRAVDLSAQYPSVPALKIREYTRKATSVTGDYHHAGDLLEDMTRARVMLGVGKGGNEAAERDVETIVQAAEGLNRASSAETLRPILNAFVKAKALYGDTVRADTFRDYTKQAGTSVVGLDDSYLTGVVPAMLQENAQWGVAQMTALGQMSRPVQKKPVKKALAEAGLLGAGDRIKGGMLARKNPYEYANTILADALKGAGVDIDKARDFTDPSGQGERLKIGDKLASWFPDRKASLFWEKQILDKTKIDRNVAQTKAATGLEGAPTVLKEDPYTGLGALSAQVGNFVSVLSAPAVKEAGANLGVLAGHIGGVTKKLTDATADNPEAAKQASIGATTIGAGLLSYGAGSAAMRLAGGATGVLANGLRIGGTALQAGGAATTFGVPALAGVAGGAYADWNLGGNEGAIGALRGGETSGEKLLRANAEAVRQRKAEAEAEGAMSSVSYPESFARRLAPVGDAAGTVATPVASSRGMLGDFLWGREKATYNLPAFGPAARTPVSVPPVPGHGAIEGLPSAGEIAQATAALAGYRKELAGVSAEMASLKDLDLPGLDGASAALAARKAELEAQVAKIEGAVKAGRGAGQPAPSATDAARAVPAPAAPAGPVTVSGTLAGDVNATGTVTGQTTVNVEVKPSGELISVVAQAREATAEMRGQLQAVGALRAQVQSAAAAAAAGDGGNSGRVRAAQGNNH